MPVNNIITILVVDDDEPVRNYITHVLIREGYQVFTCNDGTEVKGMLEAHPDVALMIIDVFMPGQDGIETLSAIKVDRPGIKVIAISGLERKSTLLQIAGISGADAVMEKPFERQVLLDTVGRLLGK